MDKQQKRAVKKKAKKTAKRVIARLGLQDASPYLASLLDPFNRWGAKVPDNMTAPSFVVHCVQRVQMTIAAGTGANPMGGAFVAIGDLQTGGPAVSCLLTNGATNASIVQVADINKPYAAQLLAVSQARRVVSAGLYMSYQGTPLTAKGRVCVAFIPATTGATMPPTDINADVLSQPYLTTFPANVGFAKSLWLPLDPLARSYMSGASAMPRGLTASGAASPGYLLILIDGGTVGDALEFTIVENYECIAASNALSLTAPTPSKSDPIELAAVDNFVSANPNITIQQDIKETMNKTAATTSQATEIARHDPKKHESGFLDAFLSGAGKVLDFGIREGPKIARAVAPLLL